VTQLSKRVRLQIEKINDSSSQEFVDVLAGVQPPINYDPEVVAALTDLLRQRKRASSARDVLPSIKNFAVRPSTKPSAGQSQPGISLLTKSDDPKSGLKSSMEGLLGNGLIKANLAKYAEQFSADNSRQVPRPNVFWSSGSVRLHLRRDDLTSIVDDANISDIALNRRLPRPPTIIPARQPDPLDENHLSAWGLEASGALATWGATGRRGEGVQIGLLDTGIDSEHPDLRGKIANWAEFDEFGHPVSGSIPHDTDQHGTHCAGILVGGDHSGKWIGLAPGAKVAGALVLGGDHATDAQILAGFEWCIDLGVDVISMSLGGLTLGPEPPVTYTRAALTAVNRGIAIVAGIGNNGSETSTSPGNDVLIISVGAIDHENVVAAFSGGRTEVIEESTIFPQMALPMIYSKPDLSAPGVAIYSSIPDGKWQVFSGTSMATPHVSAAIALLLSATDIRDRVNGIQRVVMIENLLTGSANEVGEAGQNHRYGFGTLNVLRAIGAARDVGF
jgi:subtilisin family serine protease